MGLVFLSGCPLHRVRVPVREWVSEDRGDASACWSLPLHLGCRREACPWRGTGSMPYLGGSRAARLIATSTAVLYLLALATLARATRLPFPATPRRRASRLAAPPQGPPCWREIHGLLVDFPFPSEMVNSLNLEAPLLHQELTVAIVFRVVPSREEAPSHHLEG